MTGNANYQRGRRKEWAICHRLREQGFMIAQRSAGSRSPIDIFAIHKEKKLIKFIQAKPDRKSVLKKDGTHKAEAQRIHNELDFLNENDFKVEFELI